MSVMLGLVLFVGCVKIQEVRLPPRDVKVALKSVAVKLGAEKILSDKILIDRKLAKVKSKSGWLRLIGAGEGRDMELVELPATALMALIPKAELIVTFEAANPNKFKVLIGSMAFGLSEETIVFFPLKADTAQVWVDVPAGETVEFDIPMTILKIPSLAAIAWPAIESGKALWKARGTIVVVSEEIPSGGMRQRFETGKVGTSMLESEDK